VGEGEEAHDLTRSQEWCRELKDKVDASYRVWWRRADAGRVWWIELRFRSMLTEHLDGSTYGRARLGGVEGDDGPRNPGRDRRAGELSWGGSAYDTVVVRPGESRRLVDVAGGAYVSTSSDMVLSVERVEVLVYHPRRGTGWCSLPVPEQS
jgi:hypothetical protein